MFEYKNTNGLRKNQSPSFVFKFFFKISKNQINIDILISLKKKQKKIVKVEYFLKKYAEFSLSWPFNTFISKSVSFYFQ